MECLQVFDKDKNMLDEKIERDKKFELPENKLRRGNIEPFKKVLKYRLSKGNE